MLDNTLTLSVDPENDGNPVNETWTRLAESNGRSTYKGPLHTFVNKDVLDFFATLPKRIKDFFGVAKSGFRFTESITVATPSGGTVEAPLIGEVRFAVPVGATEAQMQNLRQRMVTVLDNDAIMVKVQENLET